MADQTALEGRVELRSLPSYPTSAPLLSRSPDGRWTVLCEGFPPLTYQTEEEATAFMKGYNS